MQFALFAESLQEGALRLALLAAVSVPRGFLGAELRTSGEVRSRGAMVLLTRRRLLCTTRNNAETVCVCVTTNGGRTLFVVFECVRAGRKGWVGIAALWFIGWIF